ncbi:hypothetical protein EBL89_15095 [Cereibacter sphaeroides]|uniref:hypothetical protein n=1 Tax=Cereibacter sphaeroides TaxID=1063 RepID=UPI000F545D7E|nr:hypothetical protein [Cereibacter sphaeroides]AZB56558.1 hypothetical protein EBL89_15095 [Cereibacter sphaeroides]AZB60817.1 hypothetical protein EBL88_14935 [Cereibacter sphaeroides]
MTPVQAVRRFAIYLVVSIVILALLLFGEDFRDPQAALARMGIFAVAVTATGYVMVRRGLALPPVPVDTINSAAVILAAVVFFVGDHKEREEIRIDRETEAQNNALEDRKAQLADLEVQKAAAGARLEAVRQQREESGSVLERTEAIALIEREAELALELEAAMGLSPAVRTRLEVVVRECRSLEQRLEFARSMDPPLIEAAPRFGLDDEDALWESYDLTHLPLSPEQAAARGRLEDDVIACKRQTEGLEEVLAMPPGFARLIGLLTLGPIRMAEVSDPGAEALEQMDLIADIHAARSLLLDADRAIAMTEGQLSATSEQIEVLLEEQKELKSSLDDLAEQARLNRGQNLVWLVRQAREFGKLTWPFLLILFLGMKFACVRPFHLPPGEGGK